jgi:tetratricopeptide (TPR) repeat protein
MRLFRPTLAAVLAAALLVVSLHAEPEPPPEAPAPRLTLRLRDVPLNTVLETLFRLAGQGYVTGGDLVGHVDVEIVDATADEVERTLEATGLTFSEPAKLRRVTLAGEQPTLDRSGAGHPISLEWGKPADMRDILLLFQDVTGDSFVAPSGPLGRLVLFCHEAPVDDALRAALSATGLDSRREPGRVLVFRRTDPKAVLLPLDAGGRHTGHVGYREGEAGPKARSAGINGILVSESRLVGLARAGETWTALLECPGSSPSQVHEGQHLYDGIVESIAFDRVVFKKEDGTRSELALSPSEPGIVRRPDRAETTVARATARVGAGEFEEADRILRTALAAGPDANETNVLRAGLADAHYRWGQVLADRYATAEAIRHFEEAYAIDGTDRLWQAGEDLNEIGFLWTALGEPERAEGFHRRALEVSRTSEAKKEPRRGSCGRYHLRADWSKGAALDGLANAERARGRFAEAATLYAQALAAWVAVGDGAGQSAALTGLGLVRHGQGRYAEALALHRRALEKRLANPSDRAAILDNIGSAQLALRQTDQARGTLAEALALYRGLGDRAGEGIVLNNLGAAWEAASDRAQACADYADALAASRDADDRRGATVTTRHLQRLIDTGAADDRSLDRCRAALSVDAGPR